MSETARGAELLNILTQNWIVSDGDDGDAERFRWLIAQCTRLINRNTLMIQLTISSPQDIGDIPSEVRGLIDMVKSHRTLAAEKAELVEHLNHSSPGGVFNASQVADLIMESRRESSAAAIDRANRAEVKLLGLKARMEQVERRNVNLEMDLRRRREITVEPWE